MNSRFTVGEGVTNSTLIYQFEPDNLTFLNCTFADVYGPNFVGENKPLTPAVPTVATGCKLYNCKTESGSDIYQSIPATVRNTVLQLSKEQMCIRDSTDPVRYLCPYPAKVITDHRGLIRNYYGY